MPRLLRVSTGTDTGAIGYGVRSHTGELYFIVVLLLANTLNYLDRNVINILAELIREDLNLKDWQLGALTGLSFALLYTLTGIPVARIAERVHRPTILGGALVVWSVFTMTCGAAQSFFSLALARAGVGLGEACGTPTMHSLAIDRARASRRASAMAVLSLGMPFGSILGMGLGGIIAENFGWRTAFVVAGAPGIIVGLIILTSLRDPRGGQFLSDLRKLKQRREDSPTMMSAFKELMTKKSFPLIAFGSATGAFVGFIQNAFYAAFFLRAHPQQLEDLASSFTIATGAPLGPIGLLGLVLGLVSGLMGIIGTLIGGWMTDRLSVRGRKAFMTVPAVSKLISAPMGIAVLLVGDLVTAFVLLSLVSTVRGFSHGPALSSVHALVRPELRPTTSAILIFIISCFSLGIGPVAVGLLSDTLSASGLGQTDGLRFALVTAETIGIFGAMLFVIARPIYAREATT